MQLGPFFAIQITGLWLPKMGEHTLWLKCYRLVSPLLLPHLESRPTQANTLFFQGISFLVYPLTKSFLGEGSDFHGYPRLRLLGLHSAWPSDSGPSGIFKCPQVKCWFGDLK